MAEFDENAVKRPELQKLPDLPATSTAKPAEPATPDKSAEDAAAKAGEKPADATAAKNDEPAAKKDEAAAKSDDAAKKGEPAGKAYEAAAKKNDDTAKKDDAAAKKDETAAKTPPAPEKDTEKIMAERKMIEAENQRKLDDYQALVKKGQENVKDLNLRFGDWYFVVNDDVFRKIRLSKDKVVKKKEKKAEGAAGAAGQNRRASGWYTGITSDSWSDQVIRAYSFRIVWTVMPAAHRAAAARGGALAFVAN